MNLIQGMKYTTLSLTAVFLSSCAAAPPSEHQFTVTAERMRRVHTSRDATAYPEQVIEKPTPADTWQKLNRFARFETVQVLPDRMGCPDCADGSAEWIELQQDEVSKRVTFEPSDGLPQQAELLAELRKLYEELDPAE